MGAGVGVGVGAAVGVDKAICDRLGDGAVRVDVGDSTPSRWEKTLSATLSSPDSKPESLVKVPWLARLQARQGEVDTHASASLADIQVWSDAPRDRPLFETLMVFENYPIDRIPVPNGPVRAPASPALVRAALVATPVGTVVVVIECFPPFEVNPLSRDAGPGGAEAHRHLPLQEDVKPNK